MIPCSVTAFAASPLDLDPDSDGEGISGFREIRKHGADPKERDSDKDGSPDGDWRERREFAHTVRRIVLAEVVWTESEVVPASLREAMVADNSFGLFGRVEGNPAWEKFKSFTAVADQRFFLEAPGHPTFSVSTGVGGVTFGGTTWILLAFGPADRRDLVTGVRYRLRPRNETASGRRWVVPENLVVTRSG